MKSPHRKSIQVELGKVEGFWSTLQVFECSAAAHWLMIRNQLRHVNNDVIKYQIELEPIGLCHLEIYDRALYL